MQVKCIPLSPPPSRRSTPALSPQQAGPENGKHHDSPPNELLAWVIDGALSEDFLTLVNDFRVSLPLDAKRPTVKRRFFSSAQRCPVLREGLTTAIRSALSIRNSTDISCEHTKNGHDDTAASTTIDTSFQEQLDILNIEDSNILPGKDPDNSDQNHDNPVDPNEESTTQLQVHVLAYMRFLEYDTVGGKLDPHTDGHKICEDTNLQSTHTMLLYLRDCDRGGETVLLEAATATRGRCCGSTR